MIGKETMKLTKVLTVLLFVSALQAQSFQTGTNPQPVEIQQDAIGPFVVGGTLSATLQHGWNPGPDATLHVTLVGTRARFFTKGQTKQAQRSDGLLLPLTPFDDRLDIALPVPFGLQGWNAGHSVIVKQIAIDCLDAEGRQVLKDGDVVFVILSMSGGDLTFSDAHLALMRVVSTKGRR